MSSVFDVNLRRFEKREACKEIQRRVYGEKPELVEGAPTRFEKHEVDGC